MGAYFTLRLPLHGNVGQCHLCGVSIAGFTWGWLQSWGDFLRVHFLYVQLTRSSKFVPLSHSTGRIPEVLDSLIHNIGDHEFEEIFTSSWWVALAFLKAILVSSFSWSMLMKGCIRFFWSIHWKCWSVGTRSITVAVMDWILIAYTCQEKYYFKICVSRIQLNSGMQREIGIASCTATPICGTRFLI